MSNHISLCEFLAKAGGISAYSHALQRMSPEGGDLLALEADKWHRARPFRKKLIHTDGKGRKADDMAHLAWENGYFGEGCDRPDINDLLVLIERELSGQPVYSTDDAVEIEMEAMAERNRRDEACEIQHVESKPAAAIEYYERAYENRKGKPGVQYLAKVTFPGSRKPALHTVFRCPADRDATVQSFLAGVAA